MEIRPLPPHLHTSINSALNIGHLVYLRLGIHYRYPSTQLLSSRCLSPSCAAASSFCLSLAEHMFCPKARSPLSATPQFVLLKELAGHRHALHPDLTALRQEHAHRVGTGAIIAKLVGHHVRFGKAATTLVFPTRRLILAVTLDKKIQNAVAFREKFVF